MTKNDLIVKSREILSHEHFHYNQAYLLMNGNPRKFMQAIKNSLVAIDLRMHLKDKGIVRNHGTAFRCTIPDLKLLYNSVEEIVL